MIENEKIQNAQARINACKSLLADSDYQIYKIVEGMLSCKTFTDLLVWFATVLAEYGDLIERRVQWRADINEAEIIIAQQSDEYTSA